MNIRIGQGIDFHRLEPGRDLWLGGVRQNADVLPIPTAMFCCTPFAIQCWVEQA